MPEKITYAELMEKLNDPEVSIDEIQVYFKEVPNPDQPFAPQFEIDRNKVELPEFSEAEEGVIVDVAVGLLNRAHMRRRQRAFEKRMRQGWRGLRMVAEGDSWFQYPLRRNDDLIDFLAEPIAIYCLSAAGDELENMLRARNREHIADIIRDTEAQGLLFSGGGNDIAGDGFVNFIEKASTAEECIKESYTELLAKIEDNYRSFFSDLFRRFPKLKVFIHGYDHAIPAAKGSWLGPSLKKKQIPESLWAGIVIRMIDRYNDMLKSLAAEFPGQLHHVNCVGAIGGQDQWRDELHGKTAGCQRAAQRFTTAIGKIWPNAVAEAASVETASVKDVEAAIEAAAAEATEAPNLIGASEEQLQEASIIPDADLGLEGALSEEPPSLESAVAESTLGQVAWPADDKNAPDYAHFDAPQSGGAFELTADDLELLIRANHFEPRDHKGMILFGLRGAALQSGHEIANASSIPLHNVRPNHLTFRCVLGFYNRGTRKLWAYTASTVPNALSVKKYYKWQNGLGDEFWANQLPTGCYTFRRASHGWDKSTGKWKVPVALRLTLPGSEADGPATVLRSKNNLVIETDDVWHKSVPADNIHPAFSTTAFSSAGCLTIRGSAERFTNNATEQWKPFLSHILAIPPNGRIDLVLLTGAEGAIASDMRARGTSRDAVAVQTALGRLRTGSRGEAVERLQKFLGMDDDGVFGADTRLELTKKQKTVAPLNRADGVYSPKMDVLFGASIFAPGTG